MKTIDKIIQGNRKLTNFKAAKCVFYEIVAKLATTKFPDEAETELDKIYNFLDRLAEIADNNKPSDIEIAYFVGGVSFVSRQIAELEKRVFGDEKPETKDIFEM